MIKFFRKIRQQLITQNKMGKYFTYAIGEILLVVIGILIALQINNWNEHKQERKTEQKILQEILIDLEVSKGDLENDLKINIRSLATTEKIKKHLYYKKPYHDSISFMPLGAQNITQFTPRTSGYENLKSVGLSIISNDSLRKEITNVFDRYFDYARLEGRVFNERQNSTVDLSPYINKYFEVDFDNQRTIVYRRSSYTLQTNDIKIRNYKALLADEDLITSFQKTIYDRAYKISIYTLSIRKIDKVSAMIEKELKRLKND